MCKGDGCPVRDKCKRFNAEPGMMQPYFTEIPGEWKDETDIDIKKSRLWKCDMFWGDSQDNIFNVLKKATGVQI